MRQRECVQEWWEGIALNDGVAQVSWYRVSRGLIDELGNFK
jgi:hypothetical protein